MTTANNASAFATWLAEQADLCEDTSEFDAAAVCRELLVKFCQTDAFKSNYEIYPEKTDEPS